MTRTGRRNGRGRRKPKLEQLNFDRLMHGGARPGARRLRSEGSGVSHAARARVTDNDPVLVTTRIRAGLPSLRSFRAYRAIFESFQAGCAREGFRLVQFSVQTNHLHLIVEADDRSALSRGLQGLFSRIARTLNKLWRRTGSVFSDRYHDRILRSPRQVRNALRYVLNNVRKHCAHFKSARPDSCSSGAWFTGWRESFERTRIERSLARPVAAAKTWLLHTGWREFHPPISVTEAPARP